MRPQKLLYLLIAFGFLATATQSVADRDLLFVPKEKYQNVLVKRVKSADTIILEGGEQIKMIGLKAPEATEKKPAKKTRRLSHGFVVPAPEDVDPLTKVEDHAFEYVYELLAGQHIRIEFDKQRKNKNLRTVGYIFLKDGTFVNAEILRQGFAQLQIRPPNTKYADTLRKAYKEARAEKRGLQGE